ncbi:GPI alpha-1,4-mannosyltransferase I, catalytic subunit-like [Clavelina lepadiformis]|uniref:GPI alpha-1,4-mannosyltransferase I, catalytic subunit-like n=1 Tax=Clavelina lepadiformis TaxID=159417 RepID=UPI004043921F
MLFLNIYATAIIMRLLLLCYGEWQDLTMKVKFTDVDYFVFVDASEFVSIGESPYYRATYRYSPLLAWLLTPCVFFHKVWGKVLFVIADIASAICIQNILMLRESKDIIIKTALFLWLFNPVTATVSCRGNAESIFSFVVLLGVRTLLRKQTIAAGIVFALAIHLKIYPAIYTLCILFFLGEGNGTSLGSFHWRDISSSQKLKIFIRKTANPERLKFIFSSGFTFLGLTIVMYYLYGYDFLQHTYLYHATRRDIRHNFSVYFYMLYINPSTWLNFLCFIFQIFVICALSYTYYNDIPFCFFLLTYVFVMFNKICTSQYFLWYLSLLPLLVDGLSHLPLKKLALPVVAWFSMQGIWLLFAGLLEFNGINTFFPLWMSGIMFYIANGFNILWLIKNYRQQPLFDKRMQFKTVDKLE